MKGMYVHDQRVVRERVVGVYHHRYEHSVPMFNTVREAIYEAQNGGRRPLTVRQLRQLRRTQRRQDARDIRAREDR